MEKLGLSSRRRFRCLLRTDRQLGVLDPAVDLIWKQFLITGIRRELFFFKLQK